MRLRSLPRLLIRRFRPSRGPRLPPPGTGPEPHATPLPRDDLHVAGKTRRGAPAQRAWRTVACSVAGASHLAMGRPCDDVSVVAEAGPATLLAVADGAGSAHHARKGATVAVGAAVDTAVRRLAAGGVPADPEGWRLLLIDCLRSARRAVDACDEPREELACTLLVAILHGDTLAATSVGDGWVVAQDGSGEPRAMLRPAKGEHFNETFFVSSERFVERASFYVQASRELSAVAVLSDGLEMAACDLAAMEPFRGFFEPLFAFVRHAPLSRREMGRELEAFLGSDRVNRKTDDDKTLAVAVRRERVGRRGGDGPAGGGGASPA